MNYEWTNPLTDQKEQSETQEEAKKRAWDQLQEFVAKDRSQAQIFFEVTKLTPFPHRGFGVYFTDPDPAPPEAATPPADPLTPSQRIQALRERTEVFASMEATNTAMDPLMRMLVLATLENAAALRDMADSLDRLEDHVLRMLEPPEPDLSHI